MRTIYPKPVSQNNFQPYGQCINLFSSNSAVLDRPLKLGLTFSNGGDFICSEMERHKSTEEYLFSGESEMILAVSNDNPDSVPHTENIKAFSVKPGILIKLNHNIWHAACHNPSSDSYYYFMAHNDGSPDETKWFSLYPENVNVSCGHKKNEIFENSIFKEQMYPQSRRGIPSNKIYPFFSPDHQLLGEHIIYQDENICTGNNWRCWMTDDNCLNEPSLLQIHILGRQQASTETFLLPDISQAIFCGNSYLTVTISDSFTKPCFQEKATLKPGELLKLGTAVKKAVIVPILESCNFQANNTPKAIVWFYTLSQKPLKLKNN